MRINLIYAKSSNNVIGNIGNIGGLPWSIPEDMQYFMSKTNNCSVIMGRTTWESIPEKFRPLKSRKNIVLSNNPSYVAQGAVVCTTIEQSISACETEEVWVIGGGLIYNLFIGRASRAFVTEIHCEYDGDTFAPILDYSIWREETRDDRVSVNDTKFDFVVYSKIALPL